MTTNCAWTQDDIDRLVALRKDGLTVRQIAVAMGRTFHSVKARANRLIGEGVITEPSPVTPMNPWTAEDDAALSRLRASGLYAREIGAKIGRTEHAVMGRMSELRAKGVTFAAPQRRGKPKVVQPSRPKGRPRKALAAPVLAFPFSEAAKAASVPVVLPASVPRRAFVPTSGVSSRGHVSSGYVAALPAKVPGQRQRIRAWLDSLEPDPSWSPADDLALVAGSVTVGGRATAAKIGRTLEAVSVRFQTLAIPCRHPRGGLDPAAQEILLDELTRRAERQMEAAE